MDEAVGNSNGGTEQPPNGNFHKIVIIGDGGCGKTSIGEVFVKGTFPDPEAYEPTVYSTLNKDMTMDGQTYKLQIEDTAGQEEYRNMRSLVYPGTHCFIVCFDVGSNSSFKNVESIWMPETVGHSEKVVLCGTKSDLRKTKGPDCVSYLKNLPFI